MVPLKGLVQSVVVPEAREPHRWKSPQSLYSVSSGRALTCPVFYACQSVSSWKSPSAGSFAGVRSSSWSCSAGLCHDSSRGAGRVLVISKHLWSLKGHEQLGVWLVGWCWPQRKAGWLAGWRKEGWAGDGHRRKLSGWWVVAGEGRNQMPGKAGFGMGLWPWWSVSANAKVIKKVSWWKRISVESRWPCRVIFKLEHLIGPTLIIDSFVPSSAVSLTPLFGWLLIQGMLYCSIFSALTRPAGLNIVSLIDWLASCTQNSQIGPPSSQPQVPQFRFIGISGWSLSLFACGTAVQSYWCRCKSHPHSHWYRSLASQVSLAGAHHCLHVAPQSTFIGVTARVLLCFRSSYHLYYSHSFIGSTVESLDIRYQISPFEVCQGVFVCSVVYSQELA
ncbi:hypothetical protein MP228_003565 [Amoeboaphelidium protococcarum]|nr:hypothetical protein MP228_003565 [Amoeboaphelidium protococcarum]